MWSVPVVLMAPDGETDFRMRSASSEQWMFCSSKAVGLLVGALDHVLPWRICLGLAFPTKFVLSEVHVSCLDLSQRKLCSAAL